MGRLEDLSAFVTLSESESLSHAARRLGVAKSAVSRRLAQLENRYETTLITRTGRQWQLTDTGRSLLDSARSLVDGADELDRDLRGESQAARGPIRVSLPLQFGNVFLTPVLLSFVEEYPDIHLTADFSDRFVDMVEERYDLAIRIGKPTESGAIMRKLSELTLMLYASPDYLSTAPELETPRDLKSHKIAHYNSLTRFQWTLTDEQGGDESVLLRSSVNSDNAQFLVKAAIAGLGIVRLPGFLVQEAVDRGELVRVLRGYTAAHFNIYALYPETRRLTNRVRTFLDYLVAHC